PLVGQRVELRGRERLGLLLRVAVDVGEHRQERRRVLPLVAPPRVGHPYQFPQRQRAGLDADDAGELPDESPGVSAGNPSPLRICSNCWSSFGSSNRLLAVSTAFVWKAFSFASALAST